mgnify:FL=1
MRLDVGEKVKGMKFFSHNEMYVWTDQLIKTYRVNIVSIHLWLDNVQNSELWLLCLYEWHWMLVYVQQAVVDVKVLQAPLLMGHLRLI